MSHKATNWAIEQRGLKPIAKILLWRLADRHNPDHGCFPDQASLAHDCEISRASVNRHLDELERLGLIRREKRVDPSSRKQLATRYILAFEHDFGTPHVVARVSDCDTDISGSRVSETDQPVSQNDGETVSQSCETLTSNRTSNGTGKALRDTSEQVSFDDVWNAYPRRPMTNRKEALAAFNALGASEHPRLLIAARRFQQWHIEDSAARKVDPASQLEFRIGLGRWIRSGAWVEALSVPLKSDPVPPLANGLVVLTPDHPDFAAVERLRGRKVPLGQSGRATFRIEEIEQARAAA